ncbi:hypothetical protein MUK70_12215 [Dyadobacter chenwenxiniae]|uniref:Abi-like protein n=1 Tax=Dyadobacter chenwenxiniae TaxID=2906456 RepID=A0A9X1PIX4_9BACT|nr:hypothetical protein [Dyadobacter chenwenxiniae]MCF0060006.1 hypothetical protein [Dyadobacter chenwenxiniae]UON85746.1 hypothetical protein MUK70_12215 [Dyadobacter chenwenxiniae]
MHFDNFTLYFSEPRVSRFLQASQGSPISPQSLYKGNLKVSQAFHPLLGILEVVLRNRLNDVISEHFLDTSWITNQRKGFMSDPILTFLYKKTGLRKTNDFLIREVTSAEKRIIKSGTSVTTGKIIAELPFGFWTDLFEVNHYKLLQGTPIQIFQVLPAGYGRKDVKDTLDVIRRFRNRINHNEPICFEGFKIDFNNALNVHLAIVSVLNWIDPDLVKFISDLDQVEWTIDLVRSLA